MPAALVATVLVLASSRAFAQDIHTREQPRGDVPSAARPAWSLELALGGDGLAARYRNALGERGGYGSFGLFVSEDDDLALEARWMRSGTPLSVVPLELGVGLGAFAAFVDGSDSEVAALTVTGGISYALGLGFPLRLATEASYAPDVSTFADGKRILDVQARIESDFSAFGSAFVGVRLLEVDVADEDDAELDRAFHLGVRLGF